MKAFVQKRTHQLVLDPGATPAIGFPDGFVHKITVDSSPVKLKIQAQADTAQIDHHAVSSIIYEQRKSHGSRRWRRYDNYRWLSSFRAHQHYSRC